MLQYCIFAFREEGWRRIARKASKHRLSTLLYRRWRHYGILALQEIVNRRRCFQRWPGGRWKHSLCLIILLLGHWCFWFFIIKEDAVCLFSSQLKPEDSILHLERVGVHIDVVDRVSTVWIGNVVIELSLLLLVMYF